MNKNVEDIIKKGGLVILPTDTLYGIHASALNQKVVENVYQIRGRAPTKPFIILISSVDQLKLFGIEITMLTGTVLVSYWPGKVSLVLPCPNPKFEYLHRGTKSLAFRLPDKKDLTDLIDQTGPLVSTSVNPEGKEPAKTIEEAKNYFGDKIDFYEDQGRLDSLPSTLIAFENNQIKVLRQGEVVINED